MTQVFLYQNGQQVGPYQVEDLQNWIQAGQLKITDQAWFEGCPNCGHACRSSWNHSASGGQGDRTADVPFAAYEGEDAYLFISYSHQDAHLVYPEMHQLRDADTIFGMMKALRPVMNGQKKLPKQSLVAAFLYASFLREPLNRLIVETKLIWH